MMDEKPVSRYSPCVCVGGGGAVVTNDWCIIHRNKDEILDKVFLFFISFINVSPK